MNDPEPMDATPISLEKLTTPVAAHLLEKRKLPGEAKPLALRPGDQCPVCSAGRLEYDGCLNLACPDCPFLLAGGFT